MRNTQNFLPDPKTDLGQILEAIKENGKVDAGRWKHPELPFDFGE